MSTAFHYGTGRRKTATARTRIYTGTGNIVVNGRPYQEYFNRFFAKDGAYADFVKMDATKTGSGVKAESKTRDSYGLVVRVLRADLEKRLIEDQILKK